MQKNRIERTCVVYSEGKINNTTQYDVCQQRLAQHRQRKLFAPSVHTVNERNGSERLMMKKNTKQRKETKFTLLLALCHTTK